MRVTKADAVTLRKYLEGFSLVGSNPEEWKNYLNFSLDRILKTLELIPDGIGPRSRVLELGASPYFMSLLLSRCLSCEPEYANYFGKNASGIDLLTEAASGRKKRMPYLHFNVERDRFPCPSNAYDLVLCCEIIEHLSEDPVHMLVEINRVLKRGGRLIITTPNALRYENIMKLILGRNIYDHYSGYGPYGRHNREYTPQELRMLVEVLGFEVERLYTKVTGSMDVKGFTIKRFRGVIQLFTPGDRGGNIFLLARKKADAEAVYPPWLFESMHVRRGFGKRKAAR